MAKMKDAGLKGGQQWVRVSGRPLRPQDDERNEANVSRLNSQHFVDACLAAGIKATKRQASKWNNMKGAAYNVYNRIKMNGFVIPEVEAV